MLWEKGTVTGSLSEAVTVVGGMVGYTNLVSVSVEESGCCGYYAMPHGCFLKSEGMSALVVGPESADAEAMGPDCLCFRMVALSSHCAR